MAEIIDFNSRKEAKKTVVAPIREFIVDKTYYVANIEGVDDTDNALKVYFQGMQYVGEGIIPALTDGAIFRTDPDVYGMAMMFITTNSDDIFDTKEEAQARYTEFHVKLSQKLTTSVDSFIKYSAETILQYMIGKRLEIYIESLKLYYPELYAELCSEGKIKTNSI